MAARLQCHINGGTFRGLRAVCKSIGTDASHAGPQINSFKIYTPIKGIDYFDGLPGKDGKDGYTPIKGVDYFDGLPGADGKDGEPGKDGYTPIKGVDYFDGEKGDPGYTPVKGVDYFDGNDGQPGKDGQDGYTPIKGVDYFDGNPGKDGKDGQPGADGYTPKRGTDYWTAADKLEIFKAIYPVNAVYVTATNKNPANLLGFGTWTMTDKAFKAQDIDLSSLVTLTTANCSEVAVVAHLTGHSIDFYGSLVTEVALTDSTVELFTIKPKTIGLSAFDHTAQYPVLSDNGNAIICYALTSAGVVSSRDVIVRGSSSASLAAGSGRSFVFSINLPYTVMLDSFCDKFYWKRTA